MKHPASASSQVDENRRLGEIETSLIREEADWHKSVRRPGDDYKGGWDWLDDVIVDPRIEHRLSRFEYDPEDQEIGAS